MSGRLELVPVGPALSGGVGLSWVWLSWVRSWTVSAAESEAVGGDDGEEAGPGVCAAGAVRGSGEGHVPAGAVDDAVVVAAQQGQVRRDGPAVVGVVGDVVGVAPARRGIASREDAPARRAWA